MISRSLISVVCLNALMVLSSLMSLTGCSETQYEPRVGDILFQVSQSPQSQAIELATGSKYTHMGLVIEQHGEFYVAEAVQPVKLTPMDLWIQRGKRGHFVAKRLNNDTYVQSQEGRRNLWVAVQPLLGLNYDLLFGWSDESFYCSEFVWKVYRRALDIELTTLQPLSSFDLTHPQVRSKLAERYGDHIPMDAPVVAPSDIYESGVLAEVYSN